METIAFLTEQGPITWSAVVLFLAAMTAACLFLSDSIQHEGSRFYSAAAALLAAVLSLFFARLLHWYFRADSYAGLIPALTRPAGGYALAGVFLGCGLAACLLKLTGKVRDLPGMLDSMCWGGCAGIALGRLSCLFNSSDRGLILSEFRSLPLACATQNAVTGQTEYRLAVFLFQAAACAGIFLFLTLYGRRKRRSGDMALLFLLLYGMSQAILDSPRYDSLYFRSNGFIGVSQLLGVLLMAASAAVISVRLVRERGFCGWYIAVWAGMLALIGIACFLEFCVQRFSNMALISYSGMTVSLSGVCALTAFLLHRSRKYYNAALYTDSVWEH